MTEEDAKEKWCPFARVVGTSAATGEVFLGAPSGFNRAAGHNGVLDTTKCLGSACMAWRPMVQRIPRPHSIDSYLKRLGSDWREDILNPGHLINTAEGYCGLAGKPEI